jgi:ParB-like chromosome segregation protein Spo0J
MKQKITWHLEKRKLKDLYPYDKNPRQLSEKQFEQLKKSVDKFGLIDRPCINADGTIIGGHQRLHVMNPFPDDLIEVMVPNRLLESKEVEELNIRLNANQGSWDQDILANEFEIDELVEWGMEDLKVIQDVLMMGDEQIGEDAFKKKKSKTCPNCGVEL